jgi:predicted RNA binding protein YcfA (HicA-like mRNA interferase family)
MSKLPLISGKQLVRALLKTGYVTDHQTGSHIILRNSFYPHKRITVPNHDELAKGMLRAIMGQTGLSHENLTKLI